MLRIAFYSLLISLQGCTNLPPASQLERQQSTAISNPEDYPLGEFLSHDPRATKGQSAFYLLPSGEDALLSRLALVEASQKSLDLQYYIYLNDDTSQLISSALLESADRGVRVRLLLDDFGTKQGQLPETLDAHPNIEVRRFNPIFQHLGFFGKSVNYLFEMDRATHRMHNKAFIADNAAAIAGGRNISDQYFNASPEHTFSDLDLLVTGPVVSTLSESFDRYWNSDYAYPLDALRSDTIGQDELKGIRRKLTRHQKVMYGSSYMAAIRKTPLSKRLERQSLTLTWAFSELIVDAPKKVSSEVPHEELAFDRVLDIIGSATQRVLIITPYLVPETRIKETLIALAKRGVDVTVLTNSYGTNDNNLVHGAYTATRKMFLKNGIEIYELQKKDNQKPDTRIMATNATLHAKAFVVDKTTVIIGSMNVDPRSYYLNTELALVTQSNELAQAVEKEFNRVIDLENSFRLYLHNDTIRWQKSVNGKLVDLKHEPYTGTLQRIYLWLLRWMPFKGEL